MPHADVDGVRISYQVRGSGTPVLMLLPQSLGPAGRDVVIRRLSERHTVVTYEQRGTGRSSPSTRQLSMQEQAEDAVAVLDAANLPRAHLFCHSTGCGIGLSVAAATPRRVVSLALINPWTWGDPHLTTMQRLRIAVARVLDPASYSRFNSALLFPPGYRRIHRAGFDRIAEQAASRPHDADDIERRLEAILSFDARDSLSSIDVPVAVVGSRDDQLMPHWFAEEAAASIPGARLTLFESGGHMLTETRTDELVLEILRHLASSDAAGDQRDQ